MSRNHGLHGVPTNGINTLCEMLLFSSKSFGLILVGIYYHNSKLAQGHEPGSSCDGETFAYRRTDRSGGEDFNGGLILFNPMDLKGEIHKINPVSTIKLKPQEL